MRSPFLEALGPGSLAGDGATGTQLFARGFSYDVNYEGLNLARPDVVRAVHDEYVRAGARVVATNSFGANRARLARHGLEGRAVAINRAAARLAREAARGGAFVAGTIGPTGLAFAADAAADGRAADFAFREQAAALAAAGVDALFVETMGRADELALAVGAARAEAPGVPLVAQISVDARLAMADGLGVDDAGARLAALGVDALGVNCCDGPDAALRAAERLVRFGLPVAASPSAGLPRALGPGRLAYPTSPDDFGAFARRAFALGVALVGGCCGTTPEHVRRAAAAAAGPRADDARDR